ncbi:YSIRK-type signal peptide-containing protein [Lactobacillus sp. PV034]|uniref:mucin-binding protein n=1 Tax=Lactobacillus sp. PV034 TaxID=2594495 RepID=UPI00223FF372|nr:YSIRK-type signal peptide-containing protein [Lactobacillus sp. PV034]QNQ81001.1 YSIRK-type signal peptide-containing protein [Lactobacillus sp. PV034]
MKKQMLDKNARFAIRKLSIGAASVLISTSVYLGLRSNDVLAEVKSADEVSEVTNDTPDLNKDAVTDPTLASKASNETNETPKKTSQDATEQTITSAPVYTTQGQLPTLDINSLFTPDQLEQAQIDTEDPSTRLTWKQKPDVSKIGNTSGIANLSYPNYDADPTTNDQGEDVYPSKNVTVNVPVLVRKAEQEVSAGQVQNTLNIINSNNNSLVAHYEWVGAKAKNDDEETPIPNSDSVSEDITSMLQSLGFEMDEGSYFPGDITNFGTKNKVATLFVHPTSTTPTLTDTPYFTYANGENNIDNVNESPDPASYIGNLGALPVGTKIEWKVAPKYDFTKNEAGNYTNLEPTNDPSISVTIPGQKPIILDSISAVRDPQEPDTAPDNVSLKEIATLPDYGNGTLLIKSDNPVKLGEKVGSPLDYVTNLDQYLKSDNAPDNVQAFKDSFKWTVAPNTQQAGYTFGAFTYNDTTGNLILFKVNPIPLNNSKTITRTISFTGLPKNPDSVTQDVTYTQSGEQTYVDEPIAWKSDKNTWDEFGVPKVAGYTPDVTKIAPKDVNLND